MYVCVCVCVHVYVCVTSIYVYIHVCVCVCVCAGIKIINFIIWLTDFVCCEWSIPGP